MQVVNSITALNRHGHSLPLGIHPASPHAVGIFIPFSRLGLFLCTTCLARFPKQWDMEQHFPLKISEDLFNLFLLLFDLFGFPGEAIQKIFEYSKRFNLLPPFSKCSNPTPPRTASKRGRLEFQEPGWSKPSMEAAKTCSNTWKLPRDASNPSMMDYPLAITDLGHRLSAE